MFRYLMTAAALTLSTAAISETITIDGTDAVYGAGLVGNGVSTAASVFSFVPGAGTFITADYLSGSTDCCSATPSAGADGAHLTGVGASTSVGSLNGISGIIGPTQMFLIGVFVDSSDLPVSTDPAPATLDFTGNTTFASLSPLLNQAFWLGDGEDGSGTSQSFFAPTGADQLLLGFADSGSFSGAPSFYGDNTGALVMELTATAAPVPLPAGLPLLGFGLVALGALRRRSA